jgi:hypothetical protein
LAKQTYALPKCGLEAALSAQICSLSANAAALLLGITTGASQAALLPCAAAVASSVRDTPIPSTPLNAKSLRVAAKFAVRFA